MSIIPDKTLTVRERVRLRELKQERAAWRRQCRSFAVFFVGCSAAVLVFGVVAIVTGGPGGMLALLAALVPTGGAWTSYRAFLFEKHLHALRLRELEK